MSFTITNNVAQVEVASRTRFLAIYAFVALGALVCWPSSVALFERWTAPDDGSQRHGFLILAASLWLIYRQRARIGTVSVRPWWPALPALFMLSAAWAVAWRAGIQDAHIVLLPAIIWCASLAVFGFGLARLLILPLGFIYLAVPAWISAHEIFQVPTVHAVSMLASLMGIENHLNGFVIAIPSGFFEVDTGCSGLHYFTVGLALAILTGELEAAPLGRRLRLVLWMSVLTIVCNWIRVLTIVVAGHLTNMHHPLVTEGHYTFGWILFGVFVLPFLWVAARTEAKPQQVAADPAPEPAAVATPVRGAILAAVACMSAIPVMSYLLESRGEVLSAGLEISPPKGSNWSGPFSDPDSRWRPVFVKADAQLRGTYVDAGGRIAQRFEVVYRSQRQGAELVNYANSLVGEGGLQELAETTRALPAGSVREIVARDAGGTQSVIWWRYDIGGHEFTSSIASQLDYGVRALIRPPMSAIVAVRSVCAPSCAAAREALTQFVGEVPLRSREVSRQ